MEVVYQTSFKCRGCVSKAQPVLDSDPAIAHWEADVQDPRKLLRIDLRDGTPTSHVVDRLQELGFQASVIEDTTANRAGAPEEPSKSFRLSTYKPLGLVLAYVLGATWLAESIHGDPDGMRAMRYFMGFFFLGFAFFKLLNIAGFADAFATYDIVARRSRSYALAYPWIEVGLGLLFVTHTLPIVANGLTAVIMAVGLIGVVSAVRRKQAIQCACLGTVFNLPMSVVTIVENSVMLAMAIGMLTALFA